MEFIAGTILLVVAIALLGFARFAVTRWEGSRIVRDFAATEAMALMITTTAVFGIAFLAAGLASHQNGTGLAEFGAAIGVVALAAYGVIRLTRRRPVEHRPVVKSPATL